MKLSHIFLGLSMLAAGSSCIKKDNYPGPNASLQGNLFQDGTSSKSTIQTCTGNVTVRLEQLNWSTTAAPQDIPVKSDGTFENSELFGGHYLVSIKGGAFWPVAPVEMDIAKGSKVDFQLTPYVVVLNFTHEMTDSTTLVLHCDLQAPIDAGIPQIIDIIPYVNTTKIVGPGASIFAFSEGNMANPDLVKINKDWSALSPAQRSPTITIPDLIPGRTFFVRVGVRFNNNDKSSNLSEVVQIDVPKHS